MRDQGAGDAGSPARLVLYILLALGASMFVLCAGTVGLLWMTGLFPVRQPAPAVLLVYEVDLESLPPGAKADISKVVAVLERRVQAGRERLAQVCPIDARRVEVGVYSPDEETVARVERLVESAGTLEFRVLCNDVDHADLIERAQKTGEQTLRSAQGKRLAWWLPVAEGRESDFADAAWTESDSGDGPGGTRWRALPDGAGNRRLEVLVHQDPCEVHGGYLEDVRPGTDPRGVPCVEFTLNSTGGILFSNLTGANVPDETTQFRRRLAIILNGAIHSAPNIESTIYDRGVITGQFTVQDVQDLVALLNAGELPARLKQVSKSAARAP